MQPSIDRICTAVGIPIDLQCNLPVQQGIVSGSSARGGGGLVRAGGDAGGAREEPGTRYEAVTVN
eukprot:COSAG03_NODE_297_length_9244_cov_14.706397_10_plen_65_part_00